MTRERRRKCSKLRGGVEGVGRDLRALVVAALAGPLVEAGLVVSDRAREGRSEGRRRRGETRIRTRGDRWMVC